MAFKIPASTSRHSRANQQAKPMVRRTSMNMITVELSERVLKQIGITSDEYDRADVLVGSGVDAGLVRIQPGSMIAVAKTTKGVRMAISPKSTEGFSTGEATMGEFVDIVSFNATNHALVIRMPASLMTQDAVAAVELAQPEEA